MKRLFISIFILIMITGLGVYCLDGLQKDDTVFWRTPHP